MNRFAIPLLATVAACGGQTINDEEARTVFMATYGVANDVQASAQAAWSTASKDLTVTVDGDTYTCSGTLDGAAGWEGSIDVTGAATRSGDEYSYELSMELVDVYVPAQDVTLNGGFDMALSMITGDMQYSYTYALSGSVDVDGAARGHADFDFTMSVEVDLTSGTSSYEASGDIAGHDVTGCAGGMSGAGRF